MRQRGFTLMATLVALVIFSLASMALLELYSRSARAKAAHDSLIARTHRAEGLLVELELGRSFEPARRGTDPDGTVWEITMVPAGAQLVRIDITVTVGAGGAQGDPSSPGRVSAFGSLIAYGGGAAAGAGGAAAPGSLGSGGGQGGNGSGGRIAMFRRSRSRAMRTISSKSSDWG